MDGVDPWKFSHLFQSVIYADLSTEIVACVKRWLPEYRHRG